MLLQLTHRANEIARRASGLLVAQLCHKPIKQLVYKRNLPVFQITMLLSGAKAKRCTSILIEKLDITKSNYT